MRAAPGGHKLSPPAGLDCRHAHIHDDRRPFENDDALRSGARRITGTGRLDRRSWSCSGARDRRGTRHRHAQRAAIANRRALRCLMGGRSLHGLRRRRPCPPLHGCRRRRGHGRGRPFRKSDLLSRQRSQGGAWRLRHEVVPDLRIGLPCLFMRLHRVRYSLRDDDDGWRWRFGRWRHDVDHQLGNGRGHVAAGGCRRRLRRLCRPRPRRRATPIPGAESAQQHRDHDPQSHDGHAVNCCAGIGAQGRLRRPLLLSRWLGHL